MKIRFFLFCSLLPLLGVCAAAPVETEGFSFVKTAGGISEYQLESNGLQVLLLPDHAAPVLTFMVTYRVGSRNEVIGTTGDTHLLEHMMFKGSQHFNAANGTSMDKLLDRIGAVTNASTWLDRTNYYENLASDRLELAVQIEADRMRGLLLREEDLRSEMTVVHNEFERGENDPIEALDKEITAVAFIAHPYHHPTIGWRSDIENATVGKLRDFYNTFYWPNNATVTIVGDFEPAAALALVRKYYGSITASPHPIPEVSTEEPPQQGPRRVVVKRPGELGVVGLAYKAPGALHPDHAAYVLLADILNDGKNSRFYRALTDKNLVVGSDAGKGCFRDNTLFYIYARLAPGITHEQVEKAILTELEKLRTEGVTQEELTRAINKEVADTAYGRDGSLAIAQQINEAIAVGDWTFYCSKLEKLKAVTLADVNRVAKACFVEDQSTTGWFVPVSEGGDAPAAASGGAAKCWSGPHPEFYRNPSAVSPEAPGASAAVGAVGDQTSKSEAGSARIAPHIVRRTTAGIDVMTYGTALRDVVTLCGSLPAGDAFNPADHPALADLTAAMLDKGTVRRDKFAVSQALEDVGATLHFGSTAQNLAFSARCLKRDVPLVLGLLAEQLRMPAFSAEEFAKLKKQVAGQYRQQLERTQFRATQALIRAIFPPGHPNRPPEEDRYLADLDAVTLEQVKAFHAAHYGPSGMLLVAVGDIDDDAIDDALKSSFAGWSGGTPLPPAPRATPLAAGRTERISMPGKASVSVAIGESSGLTYRDPDRIALAAGTTIFGGHYFSSRLMAIVRAKEGLTYGITAGVGGDSYTDGWWAINATFAPQLLDRGLEATRREFRRFVAEGVTAAELRDFKETITGSYKVALATSSGIAGQTLAFVQRGLPLSYIDEYPEKVNALTLEQVNGAIARHLDPEKAVTVMAGTLIPSVQ